MFSQSDMRQAKLNSQSSQGSNNKADSALSEEEQIDKDGGAKAKKSEAKTKMKVGGGDDLGGESDSISF